MGKISVIIPVYNVEKYLAQCLDSVVFQTYRNLEIIIVDDGSPDGSAGIYEKYARRDARIKVIRQKNAGIASARNAGLALASGEFVHFMDSDDYISPDYYKNMIRWIGDADMAVGGFYNEKAPATSILYPAPFVFLSDLDKFRFTNVVRYAMAWRFMFRRDFLGINKLRFPDGRLVEDIMFSIPAVFFSGKIMAVPDTEYFYRMNPLSILNTKNRGDTAKRHGDYRREKARLMGFMRRHGISHLMPGRYKSVYRYWLFGFIPFMKKIVGDTKVAWRLFGVPVFRAAASPAAVPARKYVAPGKVPGRPKVSVVIPVYNVEKYLAQCLESVVSQTYKNLEVIIVDDGSSDGSAKICKNYARGDKRIRIFRQKNAGQSVARNAGLALASGEFVHFLDSDDYISLDYYERMLAGIGRADMAAAGFYSEKKPSDSIRYDRPRVAVSILDKLSATDVPSQAMVWKFLFRRDFLIENDLRFPEGRINEDTVFSTAAVFFANRIAIVPLASYFYRMTPDSSLNNRSCAWLAKRREDYAVAKRALDAFAARHGISGYVEAVQGGVRSAKSFGPFGIPLVKKISYGHRVVYSLFGLIPLVKVK